MRGSIPETTEMAGFEVVFTRKKVRNINLRIQSSTGAVHVSAPHRVSRQLVENFVSSRTHWINRAQQRVLQRQPVSEPSLEEGDNVAFLGRMLELSVVTGVNKPSAVIDGERMVLSFSGTSGFQERKSLLEQFYRHQLGTLLPEMLEKWQPLVGVKAKDCRVRRMKSRWGSCNIQKSRIWMSLELAKYPIGSIEYVLVHELTHLLEPSHNKRFHRLVGEIMPDWKARNAILSKGLTPSN